jgi:GT2 family glycosyltransferase
MDLTVVVISFNTKKLTWECIESVIKNTRGLDVEIVVIDNSSKDGSREFLSKAATRNRKIKLVKNSENVGFAKANNQGVKISRGRYVLFLNSDTRVDGNLLTEMVDWMDKHAKVGVATCALKNKDGSLQGTGGYFPTLARVFSWMTIQDFPLVDRIIKPFHPMKGKSVLNGLGFYSKEREVDWVTGAFMLVRRQVFGDGVTWDEEYFMYTEDVDFCYQAKKKGWGIFYLPRWNILHYGGASGTSEFSIVSEYKGLKIFYRKHYSAWQYPLLRVSLKIGALGRMALLGILEGKETFRIYAKAFAEA